MSTAMRESRTNQMRARLNVALSAVTGLSIKLSANSQVLIPGETAVLEVELTNTGRDPVQVVRAGAGLAPAGYGVAGLTTSTNEVVLPPRLSRKVTVPVRIPGGLPVTVPHAQHLYEPTCPGMPLMAVASVELKQKKFSLSTRRFVDVAPPVEIASINPSPLVIRPDEVGVSSAGADTFPRSCLT